MRIFGNNFDFTIIEKIKQLSEKDNKTLSQKGLKLSEEVGELGRVLLCLENAHGTKYRNLNKNDALEEIVDVLIVALSIAYNLGITNSQIVNAITTKTQKWESILKDESNEDSV